MKLKKNMIRGAAAAALFAVAGSANAVVTINYDSVVTGQVPVTGASPWLTTTITNGTRNGTAGVSIRFTTSVDDPEFLTSVYFSLNDTTFTVYETSSIFEQRNCNGSSPASTGPWQMCVRFDSSAHWDTDVDPFDFFVTGLNESAFVYNNAGYRSVAHVQGIQPNCSGWIGDNGATANNPGTLCAPPTTGVPEPATLGLLGLGLLGLGYSRRRRTG